MIWSIFESSINGIQNFFELNVAVRLKMIQKIIRKFDGHFPPSSDCSDTPPLEIQKQTTIKQLTQISVRFYIGNKDSTIGNDKINSPEIGSIGSGQEI